jgi:MerR family transcriptional regulator, copper efflux regulator
MGSANKHRRAGRASSAQLGQAQQRGLYAIGQAAAASGVSAKMIRHYESVGLLPSAGRTAGNYRVYGEAELHTLGFIQRARSLGFSMKQIGELLSLWHDRSRRSETVRRLALEHVTTLERKAQELQSMANSLKHLAHACHGDSRPDCPIIDDLALPGAHGAGS